MDKLMSFFHDHDDDDGGTIERTSSSHVRWCASRPENLCMNVLVCTCADARPPFRIARHLTLRVPLSLPPQKIRH